MTTMPSRKEPVAATLPSQRQAEAIPELEIVVVVGTDFHPFDRMVSWIERGSPAGTAPGAQWSSTARRSRRGSGPDGCSSREPSCWHWCAPRTSC